MIGRCSIDFLAALETIENPASLYGCHRDGLIYIKVLVKHKEETQMDENIKKNVKRGFYSSEFWATTLASVAALLAAVGGIVDGQVAAIIVAVSEAAYAVSRGLAKR